VVRNSIVLTDTIIENGAIVDRSIVDKQVVIQQNAHVGYGVDYSPNPVGDLTSGISLVGKNGLVPNGVKVGRNCIVAGDSKVNDFAGTMVPSGTTVGYVPKA
jgi:glucose-1-phosphate adenylyltransferase